MVDLVRISDEGFPLPSLGRRDPPNAIRLPRHLSGQQRNQHERVRLGASGRKEWTQRRRALEDPTRGNHHRKECPARERRHPHVMRVRQFEAAHSNAPLRACLFQHGLWNAGTGLAHPDPQFLLGRTHPRPVGDPQGKPLSGQATLGPGPVENFDGLLATLGQVPSLLRRPQ